MYTLKVNSDILIDIYVIALVFLKILGYDTTDQILLITTIIFSLFLLLKYFLSKWNKKVLALFSILLLISLLATVFSGRTTALIIVMAVFAIVCHGNPEKLIHRAAKCWAFLVPIKIGLVLAGVIDRQAQAQWSIDGAVRDAYGFGFGHKNQFGIALIIMISSYVFLNYGNKKKRFMFGAFYLGGFYFSYYYAQSRTASILIVILLFMHIVSAKFPVLFLKGSKYVLPFCVLFSFATPILYGEYGYFKMLNILFTTRISLAWAYLSKYPFSLFGEDISLGTAVLDNGYLTIYCSFGILFFILFFYIYQKTEKWLICEKKIQYVLFTDAMLVLGTTEGAFANCFINLSIFFIGLWLKDCCYKKKTG